MRERGRDGEIPRRDTSETLQKHRGFKTKKDIGLEVKRGEIGLEVKRGTLSHGPLFQRTEALKARAGHLHFFLLLLQASTFFTLKCLHATVFQ